MQLVSYSVKESSNQKENHVVDMCVMYVYTKEPMEPQNALDPR